MRQKQFIQVELLSDSTFSKGEGTAGAVDIEIEHDNLGLPFLGGKTLQGLLRDSWLSMQGCFLELAEASERVFGLKADMKKGSILWIGNAIVAEDDTRIWVEAAERRGSHPLSWQAILEALTDIRQQTSEERKTGAPAKTTLRSIRVAIRGLRLQAPLFWTAAPGSDDLRCLSLALLATRHAGLSRNRGRGHILLSLNGDLEKTRQLARGGAK